MQKIPLNFYTITKKRGRKKKKGGKKTGIFNSKSIKRDAMSDLKIS